MKITRYLAFMGLLLFCSMQIAIAQKSNILIIASDRLILQLDLRSPKSELDSMLKVAGISRSAPDKILAGDFKAIIDDGWNMNSRQGNLVQFNRSLTDLNNNPQSEPYIITTRIPHLDGKPGYPASIKYGVNKYAKITVYDLSSGLTRFILPGSEKAKRVFLSGSFNNWSTLQGLMKKTDGGWMLDIKLDAGAYEYKYIIDGRWTTDPNNLVRVNDGAGNTNSIFYKYNYTFTLKGNDLAHRITVAGDFNQWDANELIMEKRGNAWVRPMYMADGKHLYRFMVDGQWIADPVNPDKEKGGDGIISSVLNLGETVVFGLNGYTSAHKVVVSGDFNDWNPAGPGMVKTGNGWRLSTVLTPGNYNYRFIADGKWITDPTNPHHSVEKGVTNSFLAVRPNHQFILKGYDDAKVVTLCGVFNNWEPNGYTMARENGEWVISFNLKPGKYLYKFRVDGRWILDPGNKLWEQNEQHTGNSVLWIE